MDRSNSEPVPADFGETFSTVGDSRAPAVRRGRRGQVVKDGRSERHKPLILNLAGLQLLDFKTIPLRSDCDNIELLSNAVRKQAKKWSRSRCVPRSFHVFAAPAVPAVVIVRIE